jgi:hypothetical protein
MELDIGMLSEELGAEVTVERYFQIDGRGPRPLEVSIPLPVNSAANVYRRIEEGLLVMANGVRREEGELQFIAGYPGEFVVCDGAPPETHLEKGLFGAPTSREPAVKEENWSLKRLHADVLTGPTPLITFHDFNNLHSSANFIHWAVNSPEAAEVRSQFQLWRCGLPSAGINAPIGYDANSPVFNESEVYWVNKMLDEATSEGVETDGVLHFFPESGPIAVFAMSQGGLKIRAFMLHFPHYGERIYAVACMSSPHLGTPWATHEWTRYTASRIGTGKPTALELIVELTILIDLNPVDTQFQRDMAWLNLEAAVGGGIPYREFMSWSILQGEHMRVLSPRDSSETLAWYNPDFPGDTSIEPPGPLITYCGGMDLITPTNRGDLYMDRFFLYGAYLIENQGWSHHLSAAQSGLRDAGAYWIETSKFRLFNSIMQHIETNNTEWPLTSFRLNDGQVPLQSQLMLDGLEGPYIYKTEVEQGWRYPKEPLELDMDLVRAHTLADPDKIRVFPGLSHQDLIQGLYDKETAKSDIYTQVGEDILGAHPQTP